MNSKLAVLIILAACLLTFAGTTSAKTKTLSAADIDFIDQAATVHVNRSYEVLHADQATLSYLEPEHECHPGYRPSIWFKLKVDRHITVDLSTEGTNLITIMGTPSTAQDTVISTYMVSQSAPDGFAQLIPFSCNDDWSDFDTYSRLKDYPLWADLWYYIQVSPASGITPLPSSTYRLNIKARDLLVNGHFEQYADDWNTFEENIEPWKLKGAGAIDDEFICDDPDTMNFCRVRVNHSDAGTSTLKQTIKTFKGVKLDPGTKLVGLVYLEGPAAAHYVSLQVRVQYTDGTSDSVIAFETTDGSASLHTTLVTPYLDLVKPVAKIVFTLKDKITQAGSYMDFDDVVLIAYPAPDAAPSAVLPLPLPLPAVQ